MSQPIKKTAEEISSFAGKVRSIGYAQGYADALYRIIHSRHNEDVDSIWISVDDDPVENLDHHKSVLIRDAYKAIQEDLEDKLLEFKGKQK